ncbi:MAG: glycosyltransferase [Hyphomonadaceae bacterium]|nr:glycosyltransferase [Hyphomonadaceae bacterium]
MPAYRAVSTLRQSVESVRAQTLADWELIIIDDGSPDETAACATQLAQEDSRIRVIRQRNAGPSAARNRGVRLARGDILAFLDADDLWSPERLAGMVAFLRAHPATGVAFSRTRFFDANTGASGTLTPHVAMLSAADLLAENKVCSTSNLVCRAQVFRQCGGFEHGLHFAEDQDWLVRVALDGRWQIQGVDAEWFFYRSSPDSLSADLGAMRRGWGELVKRASATHPLAAERAARAAYGPFHRYLARRALRLRQPLRALSLLSTALRRDPGLILREPKRTLFTVLGACIALAPVPALKELVAK